MGKGGTAKIYSKKQSAPKRKQVRVQLRTGRYLPYLILLGTYQPENDGISHRTFDTVAWLPRQVSLPTRQWVGTNATVSLGIGSRIYHRRRDRYGIDLYITRVLSGSTRFYTYRY